MLLAVREVILRHGTTLQKLVRFGVVGVAASITYYLASIALLSYSNVFLAGIGGFAVGVLVSYFGHKHITFRVSDNTPTDRHSFIRFAFTALAALAYSQVVLYATSVYLNVPDWIALAIVVVTVPAFTFLLYQFWVFRKQQAPLSYDP